MSFATLSEKPRVVLLSSTKRQKKAIPGPETKHMANHGIARKRVFDKEKHEKEVILARLEQSAKFRAPPQSQRPPSPPAELTPAQQMKLRREGPEKVNPALVAPKPYFPLSKQAESESLMESPLKVSSKAGYYSDEKTRLQRDRKAESELKADRLQHALKKDKALQRKGVEMARRDDLRYQKMADDKKEALEKAEKLRESGKAARNRLSMPYNPITLAYADGLDGMRLKHADDSQKYRAAMRQRNLQVRMSSSHNPITGAPQHAALTQTLDRPTTPQSLKQAQAAHIARQQKLAAANAAITDVEIAAQKQRYGRRANPYLDETGLATGYGAHYEKHRQFRAAAAAKATPVAAPAAAASAAAPAPAPAPARPDYHHAEANVSHPHSGLDFHI